MPAGIEAAAEGTRGGWEAHLDLAGPQEGGGELPAGAVVGVEHGRLLLREGRDGAPAHEVVPAALEAGVERLHTARVSSACTVQGW